MAVNDLHQTIEAIFRMERVRLIGGLARMLRDIGLAEDLAQDALVSALTNWQDSGIPDNPGAWLMATAKRRAIDGLRRRKMLERKHAEIGRDREDTQDSSAEALEAKLDADVGDDQLSLIFTACHPVLSADARAALTLRLIGGLSADEIARAFLSTEPTVAQRIVRAKKTLEGAGLSYEVPRGEERTTRLPSVLEVLYLVFNEGYAATAGDDLIRPALCTEARRLGRILAGLLPDEAEVFGLLALMEIQASRLAARTAADGSAIPVTEQNRLRWDAFLIRTGLAALARAESLSERRGPYTLQAALAACHARARTAAETDWIKIAALYTALREQMPSPVVEVGRAVAFCMAFGPGAGLALLDDLDGAESLKAYAPYYAARGDFLFRAGKPGDARPLFEQAAMLCRNRGERAYLLSRAQACG